jgi:hypothetical protein
MWRESPALLFCRCLIPRPTFHECLPSEVLAGMLRARTPGLPSVETAQSGHVRNCFSDPFTLRTRPAVPPDHKTRIALAPLNSGQDGCDNIRKA